MKYFQRVVCVWTAPRCTPRHNSVLLFRSLQAVSLPYWPLTFDSKEVALLHTTDSLSFLLWDDWANSLVGRLGICFSRSSSSLASFGFSVNRRYLQQFQNSFDVFAIDNGCHNFPVWLIVTNAFCLLLRPDVTFDNLRLKPVTWSLYVMSGDNFIAILRCYRKLALIDSPFLAVPWTVQEMEVVLWWLPVLPRSGHFRFHDPLTFTTRAQAHRWNEASARSKRAAEIDLAHHVYDVHLHETQGSATERTPVLLNHVLIQTWWHMFTLGLERQNTDSCCRGCAGPF